MRLGGCSTLAVDLLGRRHGVRSLEMNTYDTMERLLTIGTEMVNKDTLPRACHGSSS